MYSSFTVLGDGGGLSRQGAEHHDKCIYTWMHVASDTQGSAHNPLPIVLLPHPLQNSFHVMSHSWNLWPVSVLIPFPPRSLCPLLWMPMALYSIYRHQCYQHCFPPRTKPQHRTRCSKETNSIPAETKTEMREPSSISSVHYQCWEEVYSFLKWEPT